MPRISVIVPVYNTEKYLRGCLESILCQSCPDFELIIVNDGSTDSCPEICDEYAARDCRIRVIHKINAGVSAARNDALDAACGEFVTFIDSDDRINPETFEKALEAADSSGAGIVRYNFRNIVGDRIIEVRHRSIPSGLYAMPLRRWHSGWFSMCLGIFRRSLFEDNSLRFYTWSKQCEDAAMSILLYSYVDKVVSIGDVLYDRVSRPDSALHTINREGYENRIATFRALAEDLSVRKRDRRFIRLAEKFARQNVIKSKIQKLRLKKRV